LINTNLKILKFTCIAIVFAVFFVAIFSSNLHAQTRRPTASRSTARSGRLNLAQARTIPFNVRTPGESGGNTPDICPLGLTGFNCAACIQQVNAVPNTNIWAGSASKIDPITVADNAAEPEKLCSQYNKWWNCFDNSMATFCAGKSAPTCTEEDVANGYCTSCISDATPKNWWEKPAWWFDNSTYATGASGEACGQVSPGGVVTPGTCVLSEPIMLSNLGMTPAEQTEFYEKIKPDTWLPADPANAETEFNGKKDWSIEHLVKIQSNIKTELNTLKDTYNTKVQANAKIESANTATIDANNKASSQATEVHNLAIANTVTSSLAALGGVGSAITAGIAHSKAKQVNAGAKEINLMSNQLKTSTVNGNIYTAPSAAAPAPVPSATGGAIVIGSDGRMTVN
jgi:hypothetical protein